MGMCQKCTGMCKIVTGGLLLLNGMLWPQWLGIDGWIQWIAVLMVLFGAMKLFMPNKCAACNAGSKPAKKK